MGLAGWCVVLLCCPRVRHGVGRGLCCLVLCSPRLDMGGAGCVVLPLVRLPVGLCFPLLAMGSMGVSGSVLCFAPHDEARDWM